MKIKLKLLILSFCFLSCLESKSKENILCTTPIINEKINTKYAGNKEITDIWQELQTKFVVRKKGSDAKARPPMVKIQYIVESAITNLLEEGEIKYSKAVIYTPLPSTPLRANTFNVDTLVRKDFFQDLNRVETITIRRDSLQKYLANGGILYNVHNSITKEHQYNIPGLNVYKDNVIKYQTLTDIESDINTRYTGASYIAECKNGTKMFFAIKGRQAHDTRKKQWVLYYGELKKGKDSRKLNYYFKKVQNIYEEADISFDFE
ncbi:MAG: hypothetical protein HRU36_05655 [Rickettsiales bacterium]|nr:hypothetical protein [Rickettsiales bacterium]